MYMNAKNSMHSSIVNAVLCLYWFLVYKTVLDIGFSVHFFIHYCLILCSTPFHEKEDRFTGLNLIFLDLFN